MTDFSLRAGASEGSGEDQCLWLEICQVVAGASEWVRIGEGTARVTNVLVVSLDASGKDNCDYLDTED